MSIPDSAAIEGGCHCGNIGFVVRWPEPRAEIRVRRCGCTFCQKHGGAWTSHPQAELDVHIVDESLVSKYRFGTGTAEFYVCSVCGIAPFVTSEIGGGLYAVVNVNTFGETGEFSFSSSATDFDGEDMQSRLERRKHNWIANVRL